MYSIRSNNLLYFNFFFSYRTKLSSIEPRIVIVKFFLKKFPIKKILQMIEFLKLHLLITIYLQYIFVSLLNKNYYDQTIINLLLSFTIFKRSLETNRIFNIIYTSSSYERINFFINSTKIRKSRLLITTFFSLSFH